MRFLAGTNTFFRFIWCEVSSMRVSGLRFLTDLLTSGTRFLSGVNYDLMWFLTGIITCVMFLTGMICVKFPV